MKNKTCVKCIEEYINYSLTGGPSTKTNFEFLKPMKCINNPNCDCSIKYNQWKKFATQKDLESYTKNCITWLSIRCTSCHTPHTLFNDTPYTPTLDEGGSIQYKLPAECDKQLFVSYINDEIPDKAFIEKVFGAYDKTKKDQTLTAALKIRIADQNLIASQIESLEKRFQFQSQFYYYFRACITTCTCRKRMCFYCKSIAHPFCTCEQNQNRSSHVGQVNACPRCGISIVKHDGCESVKCVCGHQFTWRKHYMFATNGGRSVPASAGTRVQGWVRTNTGWVVAPPLPVPEVPRVVPMPEVRAMEVERFETTRDRLATLLQRQMFRTTPNTIAGQQHAEPEVRGMPMERFQELRNQLSGRLHRNAESTRGGTTNRPRIVMRSIEYVNAVNNLEGLFLRLNNQNSNQLQENATTADHQNYRQHALTRRIRRRSIPRRVPPPPPPRPPPLPHGNVVYANDLQQQVVRPRPPPPPPRSFGLAPPPPPPTVAMLQQIRGGSRQASTSNNLRRRALQQALIRRRAAVSPPLVVPSSQFNLPTTPSEATQNVISNIESGTIGSVFDVYGEEEVEGITGVTRRGILDNMQEEANPIKWYGYDVENTSVVEHFRNL